MSGGVRACGDFAPVVTVGPLAAFEPALLSYLSDAGYVARSVVEAARAMARMSGWMEATQRTAAELTPQAVEVFLASRRRRCRSEAFTRRGLGAVLWFLRGRGLVPDEDLVGIDTAQQMLAEYRLWLRTERGFAAESVRCYANQASKFLAEFPDPLGASLASLDAATVTDILVRHSIRSASVWSAKAFVTAVRSLLRFLHVQGLIPMALTGAVPTVAGWRLSALPRGLRAADVHALLAAQDVSTSVGRRDQAVLTVLARLGLRGAEVAALRLADVDWRGGQIVVRGKGSRVEGLPLSAEVGQAIAAYLTGGRPTCACATVFVTARAPYRPLSAMAVRAIMGRACQRAGLPRLGAAQHSGLRQGRPRQPADVGPPVAWRCPMSTVRQHAERYLAMRRALGFKLTTFGQRLLSFVAYLEARGQNVLTTEAAVAWATGTPRSADQIHWSRRLMVVRIFARHLAALDPATEIPAEDILPRHYRRITPHLFTPTEITALLDAADALRPTLRALTYRTLIGLLMVSGLRTGEACRLDRPDVDLDEGLLTVRDSKFGKSRQVPLHATTVAALHHYGQCRDELCATPRTPGFFVSTRGTRLDPNISKTFAVLVDAAGIIVPVGRRQPRLHDLRHSFTTATLLDWYRDGVDVQARLPQLSTYLGHADPKSTYWYLTGSPELLALAAARLEHAFGEQP